MAKEYVGYGRTVEKAWGPEVVISFSEEDIKKMLDLLYKGWAKVEIKQLREPKGDKTHYGVIWVPDNAVRGSQGASNASEPMPPLSAEPAEEVAEPDLSESMNQDDDDVLPF